MTGKQLPCSDCGVDLVERDCEKTTLLVDVTAEPVFGGQKGQREVPAWVCPECETVNAL